MLGFGLGLRTKHYDYVLTHKPAVDWFEIISENFMIPGGKPRRILREINANYPIVLHGVSLSLGSKTPLNREYLKDLKLLVEEVNPPWFSDHLCWSAMGKHYSHDLLPLPYTEESLKHVCDRVTRIQDFIGRPFLVENVSSYVTFKQSEMTEWEFLSRMTKQTGCKLLLDINNIYVSSRNHRFNVMEFLNGIPVNAVGQFHLAGHQDNGTHVIDTHDHPVREEVWTLYRAACLRFKSTATMIERDDNIPEFPELYNELMTAKRIKKELSNGQKQNREKNPPAPNPKSFLGRPDFR